jgi:hypothetical protein
MTARAVTSNYRTTRERTQAHLLPAEHPRGPFRAWTKLMDKISLERLSNWNR